MIAIESKRRKRENILERYPDAVIADVTSQATDGLVRLSPFYPHGGIPVPFSEGYTAMCVCLLSFTKEVTISFHSLSQPLTSRTRFPYTIYLTEFGDKVKIIQPTSGLQYKSIQLFYSYMNFFLQNNVTIVTTQDSYLITSCLWVTIEAFSIVT